MINQDIDEGMIDFHNLMRTQEQVEALMSSNYTTKVELDVLRAFQKRLQDKRYELVHSVSVKVSK